jgi:hypothetical protein
VNLATVSLAIKNAFVTQFGGTYALAFGNEIVDQEDFTGTWLRLNVVERDQHQQTIGQQGNRKWWRDCSARVEVYAPAEGTVEAGTTLGGDDLAKTVGEAVRSFFKGTSISAAKFQDASVTQAMPDTASEGRWFQVVVDAKFYFQETA